MNTYTANRMAIIASTRSSIFPSLILLELSLLRSKYGGKARMEKVIDSDIEYIAKGKFEED